MTTPAPFVYPATPHVHRHGPSGYAEYGYYKPWLRDDFQFRCAYCLKREAWGSSVSGHAEMGADHFEPKSVNAALLVTYTNLIYVCNDCNSFKLKAAAPINPLTDALGDHLEIDESGRISGTTAQGMKFIAFFRLDRRGPIELREKVLTILGLKKSYPDDPKVDLLYRRAFGYPADLPDLTVLKPPGGNAVAGSELLSHHARRARGELPDVY